VWYSFCFGFPPQSFLTQFFFGRHFSSGQVLKVHQESNDTRILFDDCSGQVWCKMFLTPGDPNYMALEKINHSLE
jgi:hypothetical protein